jgi:selenocysteine lyase/cysteine desulfurase/uncharacterized protein YcbX
MEPAIKVYADYMGAGVVPEELVAAAADDLRTQSDPHSALFRGNPHSEHRAGHVTHRMVDETRDALLAFFGCGNEYEVIFTSGCTGGLQIVARSFAFGPDDAFSCSWAAHNSLLGIREIALAGGGRYRPMPAGMAPDDVVAWATGVPQTEFVRAVKRDGAANSSSLVFESGKQVKPAPVTGRVLLGVPLECNFSGTRVPYREWGRQVASQRDAPNGSEVYTLLDAAAAAPRMPIALAGSAIDFCLVSFYKMFGYPTGIGALFVRTATVDRTMPFLARQKGYFGGGTVDMSVQAEPYHALRTELAPSIEAGTPNFHGIAAVRSALKWAVSACGKAKPEPDWRANNRRVTTEMAHAAMTQVAIRLHALQRRLAERLAALRHGNDTPVVRVLQFPQRPGVADDDWRWQGPTVSVAVVDDDGEPIGHKLVEKLASLEGIAMRAGCFCNPGACHYFVGLTPADIKRFHAVLHHVCADGLDVIEGKPLGAVRFSLGYFSKESDVDEIVAFINRNFARRVLPRPMRDLSNTCVWCAAPACVCVAERSAQTQTDVTMLYVYPVKGVFGLEVDQWPVTRSGFLLDREWMILSATEHTVTDPSVTVKQRCVTPKLNANMVHLAAFVDPQARQLVLVCRDSRVGVLTGRGFAPVLKIDIVDDTFDEATKHTLRAGLATAVPTPHATSGFGHVCEADLEKASHSLPDASSSPAVLATSIRGRTVSDYAPYGNAVNEWLSAALDAPVGLVRRLPAAADANAGKASSQTSSSATSFSNGGAFLVVSEPSHLDVLMAMPPDQAKTTFENYRANIVVSGKRGGVENGWALLRDDCHGLVLRSAGGCPRCSQVGVSRDGSTSAAPLTAIASITRQRKAADSECTACAVGAKGMTRITGQAILGELFNVEKIDAGAEIVTLRIGTRMQATTK